MALLVGISAWWTRCSPEAVRFPGAVFKALIGGISPLIWGWRFHNIMMIFSKIYSTLFNLSFGLPNSCGENDGTGKTTAAFHRCFNTAVFSRCADGLVISWAVTWLQVTPFTVLVGWCYGAPCRETWHRPYDLKGWWKSGQYQCHLKQGDFSFMQEMRLESSCLLMKKIVTELAYEAPGSGANQLLNRV